MGRVAKALGPILLSAFSAQSSGCLLDRRIVGEDEWLTPLSPPVIVAQRRAGTMTLTDPLPGEIIVVPTSATIPFIQTFRVTVFYEFPVALRVRGWTNRNLDTCISGRTCGVEIADGVFSSILNAPDAGPTRTFSFPLQFVASTCTRVDVYVSPRFLDTPGQQHVPVRPGEVAHARWYVVVPSINGIYPPLDACKDVTMSM